MGREPTETLAAVAHTHEDCENGRLIQERRAKKISHEIDEEINARRLAEKQRAVPIKVLLLGKSTTLKNFQLISSPKPFKAERASWRAVIQLNVARSICIIIDAISTAQQATSSPISPSSPHSLDETPSVPLPAFDDLPTLTPEHLKLKMRLSPILQVEESLGRKLELEATSITNVPRPTRPWKSAFSRPSPSSRNSMDSEQGIDFDDPNDPGVILHNCAEDMIKLWNDPTIRALLKALRLRLEDTPGFFLDDLERVTALKYIPTDDDVLKARLKTTGVTEHRFVLTTGGMLHRDWRIFKVGGARSLRVAAWAPFFDSVHAIILLAPLSCFDQFLVEDPTVNRLEDSLLLWKTIVSNQLLQNTQLILFLNKCDVLKAKLESGIQFNKWVVSYGDRPNTFDGVSKYMREKFATMHKNHSTTARAFYCHLTLVTDVKSTFLILVDVRESIIRKSMSNSRLL
ncbi:hypothetical protein GYMLUDRAFT_73000 [Collybiopsis luxurians FD-317 M1]|uniref:G-alpha-domain-containing protein n=1 Tax=Collybiopsis luxurians FD-317 M1 TaxID=944289 RepID=A0A0D0CZK6_9AGAR|nr:hypothetical protein GYMLUDRAFT_73000 [Collybiopsis luxurians FD-317 M1]